MKPFTKTIAVLGVASTLALTLATPSEARSRWVGPAAAGFVAGAVIGGAVASANAGYYGYYDNYAYAQGYDSYAYAPGPVYSYPRYRYRSFNRTGPHREDMLTGTGAGFID